MRKALWYVHSRAVGEAEKDTTVNWAWLRGILVQEVIHRLSHDLREHSETPFPMPFQILVQEETINGLTRVKLTVVVDEEDIP